MKILQHDTNAIANSLLVSTFGIKMISKYTFDITDQKWLLAWFVVYGSFSCHLARGFRHSEAELWINSCCDIADCLRLTHEQGDAKIMQQ